MKLNFFNSRLLENNKKLKDFNNNSSMKISLKLFFNCLISFFLLIKIETKFLSKKSCLALSDGAIKNRNITFPRILPKYPMANFTDYALFENLMLNLNLDRIQAKEVKNKFQFFVLMVYF